MNDKMSMHLIKISLFTLFATILFTLPVEASPVSEAQSRMKERLVQIDQLKADGSVGENALGLLSARKNLGPRLNALLEAENRDRRTIYQSVAERTGQSIEAVGTQRAIRIAELADSGVWLQKPDGGEWYTKP